MIVVPYGHDQSVYGRSWLTALLVALNVIAFVTVLWLGQGSDERVVEARRAIDTLHATYPDARVPTTVVATMPLRLREALADVIADPADEPLTGTDDADGAPELLAATKRLVAAVDDRPGYRFGYRPGKPTVRTAFTCLFVHGDIGHLLGNMAFLWVVGSVIECFWEHLPFLVLYFAAGIAGTAAHHLAAPDSMRPLIGASGAIAGLLGAFVVGHPKTKLTFYYATWFFRPITGTFRVPMWILIPAWFALQLGYALAGSGDGVAYWAHVGGFIAGVAGALVMKWGGWVSYDAERELAERDARDTRRTAAPSQRQPRREAR